MSNRKIGCGGNSSIWLPDITKACGQKKQDAQDVSCNNLCSYDGSTPLTWYGAEINDVNAKPNYFERVYSNIVLAPWLAERYEYTYMNRTKVLNEPPIQTYKEIRLHSIPQDKYSFVVKEGFGNKNIEIILFFICFFSLLSILLYYFYFYF